MNLVKRAQSLFFQAQVLTRHHVLRSAITRLCNLALPSPTVETDSRTRELAGTLERVGNVQMGRLLDDRQISEVTDYLSGKTCSDPDEPHVAPFTPENVPSQCHLGGYP